MSKEKSKTPTAPFALGDRVTYIGAKTRYPGTDGNVYKVKPDACLVQFDDDSHTVSGGVKTFKIPLQYLQLRAKRITLIPKPKLSPPNPPAP
jgi:hypothetical protein